jgi:catechol 2,3-dioxygenase-like lactoylglutathione lyase family enzyme
MSVPRGTVGFMTVSLHGLRSVIYPAPELPAATEWWSELLGVRPYFEEPFYVGFEVGGYELGLLPSADPADGAQTLWGVDDVAAAMAQAVALGAVEHGAATDVGDGIVTGSVRTPGGAILGFIYNPHFRAT